jgi:hypothetical protein
MSAPLHAAGLAQGFKGGNDRAVPPWAYAGVPVGLVLASLAVWLPLRAGGRALDATEF